MITSYIFKYNMELLNLEAMLEELASDVEPCRCSGHSHGLALMPTF